MLDLDRFLEQFEIKAKNDVCICILNKRLFRCSKIVAAVEGGQMTNDQKSYYRLIGYAYENHLL